MCMCVHEALNSYGDSEGLLLRIPRPSIPVPSRQKERDSLAHLASESSHAPLASQEVYGKFGHDPQPSAVSPTSETSNNVGALK